MAERYTETALHFEPTLPRLLARSPPAGPLALADLGCGDSDRCSPPSSAAATSRRSGPCTRSTSSRRGSPGSRLASWIETIVASADVGHEIPEASLDTAISTMVLEHVPDEHAYLAEILRQLRPGGRAYLTTVFKKQRAWYFRKRDGESVLDPSHLREYTDLPAFRALVTGRGSGSSRSSAGCSGSRSSTRFSSASAAVSRGSRDDRGSCVLRVAKVPIPGYYALELVVERPAIQSSARSRRGPEGGRACEWRSSEAGSSGWRLGVSSPASARTSTSSSSRRRPSSRGTRPAGTAASCTRGAATSEARSSPALQARRRAPAPSAPS